MTNTMTPSEIADWHTRQLINWVNTKGRNHLFHKNAAATIRELEARVNNQSEIIKRQAVSGANRVEALKIATEALKHIKMHNEGWPSEKATQALARIKEVR